MTHPVRQAITDDSIQTLFTELKLNVKIPSGVIFNRAFHRENFFYNQSFGKGMKSDEQNPDLSNALVLYVLSGANRGDIHVIRNVGSIGRTHSRCDIELNDCHVSQSQALIEHRDGCYWLYDTQSEWGTFVRLEEAQQFQVDIGDVLMAGEVEFTCLGSVQSRDKPSSCCLQ
ncbi:hypothetical protein ABG067_000716 [Albugo candida]